MTNILESLVVSLSLDPAKFEAGVRKVEDTLHHLGEKFKEMSENLEREGAKGEKVFDMLKEHALEFFGVIASTREFLSFTEHMITSQVALGRLSAQTHTASQELQAYAMATEKLGGSTEGTLQNLNQFGMKLATVGTQLPRAAMAAKMLGTVFAKDGEDAEQLGIKLFKGKGPIEALDMLAEKVQGMEFYKAKASLGRLGVDDSQIRLLMQGKEAMHELIEENKKYTATDEDLKRSLGMEEVMKNLKFSMEKVAATIAHHLIPAIKMLGEFMLAVSDWASQHATAVRVAITTIGIALLFMSFSALVAGGALVKAFIAARIESALAAAQFIVTGIAAHIAWLAALGPIGLIIGAVEVLIGLLVAAYFMFDDVTDAIDDLGGVASTMFNGVDQSSEEALDGMGRGWDIFLDMLHGDWEQLGGDFDQMCEDFQHAWGDFVLTLVLSWLKFKDFLWEVGEMIYGGLTHPVDRALDYITKKLRSVGINIGSTTSEELSAAGDAAFVTHYHKKEKAAHVQSPQHLPQAPTRTVPVVKPEGFHPYPQHAASTGPVGASPQAPTSAPPEKPKVEITDAQFWAAWNKRHPPTAAMAVANAATGKSGTTSSTEMHVGTINVNAPNATDAPAIASGITGALADSNKNLVNQADTGV